MKNTEEFFADYLDGKISETELAGFFSENPGSRQEFEELKQLFKELPEAVQPEASAATDDRFYAFLEEQKSKAVPRFRLSFREVFRYAAMVLAVAGAYYFGSRKPEPEVVTVEKPVYITLRDTIKVKEEAVTGQGAGKTARKEPAVMEELAHIKKEVSQINEVQNRMILAMLRQESAASRLEAINYSYNLEDADETLMDALFQTLERDPSVNVRLAALEAVGRFELSPAMRENLVLTLAEQRDPSLQMALITKLIELREVKALPVFAGIRNNPDVSESIRDRVEFGIKVLNM
ncbi:MAG: HEAT repeat domain-containing protein [Leadbetterella sp.]|nr:HEAT repeat domain-containing protein [Leadbetterella sp.]